MFLLFITAYKASRKVRRLGRFFGKSKNNILTFTKFLREFHGSENRTDAHTLIFLAIIIEKVRRKFLLFRKKLGLGIKPIT